MTILDALKREENDVRVTCGNRWLVIEKWNEESWFVVYGREYCQKNTRLFYKGNDEEDAISILLDQ